MYMDKVFSITIKLTSEFKQLLKKAYGYNYAAYVNFQTTVNRL